MNEADKIKQSLTMQEVAAHYGFYPNRSGYIPCPFHNEKTASLKIYDGQGGWHCFGCHRGGSVIDFVAEMEGLSFGVACRKIDDVFHLGLYEEKSFKSRRAAETAAMKAVAERKKREADMLYSSQQYKILCRYRRWLTKQSQTEATLFDLAFMDRLLDKFLESTEIIRFDADALVNALLSKHQNRGDYDRNKLTY